MEIIDMRTDGSFVITKNGMPYQVIPGTEEWEEVCTVAGVDKDAQATVYVTAHIPPEPPVIEEPGV